MADERVSRRDLFGLGLSRVRERFDAEIPEALAAQARRAARRPSEPAWAAWDVPPPEGSERFTRAAAEGLVQACGTQADERVLDWGCGQGEVALAAARRGAQVTAVDFAAGPLERAWDMAEDEALEVDWIEQDGLDLPLGNSWFDRSLSGFGVVWSHDVPAAVREMFRVTRPGGTVGLHHVDRPRLLRRAPVAGARARAAAGRALAASPGGMPSACAATSGPMRWS